MTTWVYIQSEPGLYTVGFYAPDGKWHPDSDHTSRNAAAWRAAALNGNKIWPSQPKLPRLKTAIYALLGDIEAMRDRRGGFGPFDISRATQDGATIEWPNLDISFDELRLALAEELKNAE